MLLILTSLNLTNLSCEDCYPCFYHCFTDDVYGAWALTAGGVFWKMLSVKYLVIYSYVIQYWFPFYDNVCTQSNITSNLTQIKIALGFLSILVNRGPEAQCRDEVCVQKTWVQYPPFSEALMDAKVI